MSRSQEKLENPCERWFKWSGSTGEISYYDKVTKQNVPVAMPFTFLLLDTLSTIKGYDESLKAGIWSNEVRNTKEEKLTVKCGNNHFVSGFYTDIKDAVVTKGGGYAQSCYIAFKNEYGSLVIGNFMMQGSSLGGGVNKPADKAMKDIEVGAWMDFTKSNKKDLDRMAIEMTKNELLCTNGATKFYCPKFKLINTSEGTNKAAIELDVQLQKYLSVYLKNNHSVDEKGLAEATAEVTPETKAEQFERNSSAASFETIPTSKQDGIGNKLEEAEDGSDLPFVWLLICGLSMLIPMM
jgi:hypothetical protein